MGEIKMAKEKNYGLRLKSYLRFLIFIRFTIIMLFGENIYREKIFNLESMKLNISNISP